MRPYISVPKTTKISQKIVEAMGGHIEIESQPGRGSSFHFTLAFDLDPNPPTGDVLDSSMTPLDPLPSRLAGTVLVSADDVVNHKPHPDTFLKVAEQLGANPANCLVFEDTRIGIQAGKAASMTTLLVDQGALCPR